MKGMPMCPEMAVAALRAVDPKTETRRLINPQPVADTEFIQPFHGTWHAKRGDTEIDGLTLHLGEHRCEYTVGEHRCMLATWAAPKCLDDRKALQIDGGGFAFWHAGMGPKPDWAGKSRPGRFLPNTLRHLMPVVEIAAVRPERLHAIDKKGALSEGIFYDGHFEGFTSDSAGRCFHASSPVIAYAKLWDTLNHASAPWGSNPWVWVINFRRVK